MTLFSRTVKPVRRPIVAVIASVVAVLALPAILFAHARLTKSTPSANESVLNSPEAIRLWFSEVPELAFTKIALLAADSSEIRLAAVQRIPGERLGVSATIGTPLSAGIYTVVWQVAAADGHPSRGRFTFTVLSRSAPATAIGEAAIDSAAQHQQMMQEHTSGTPHRMAGASARDGGLSVADAVTRFVSFVALLTLIGVACFRWLTIPSAMRISERYSRAQLLSAWRDLMLARAARLGSFAAVLLLVAAIARSYLESYAVHGASDAMNAAMMRSMLFETSWGNAWLMQVGATLLAGVALALASAAAVQGRGGSSPWAVATASIVVLAFTPAFGGHAAASPRLRSMAVLSDGLHVVGAGGWLGTLLVLVAVGIPIVLNASTSDRGGMAADLINAFSPAALAFASLIVLTGTFAAWLHIGSWPALGRSTYGRTLLIKLGVLLFVIGTGAYNWLRVRPALGDVAAAQRLRRSATVELIIGSVVILVTAVLVALQTPIE